MKKKININDTNNTKQSCRAKTQKGEPCKNKASFIYCGFHWKSKFGWSWKILVPLIFLLRILGEIGGFFNDFFIPVSWRIYQELDPPEYWECSQDQNFRGIIFNKVQTKKKDEIYLLLGLKGSQSLKTQSTVGKLWWDEPACILPFGHLGKECALKFRITDKRKLLISADLFDANHCLSGKIFDNKFIINR